MHKNKPDYIERALIELRRQYGREELFATLIKYVRERDIKIGQLESEVSYLQNELELTGQRRQVSIEAKIAAKKEQMYKNKIEKIKQQEQEIKKLRKMRDELILKTTLSNG